jgi:hypothetical protein
VNGIVVAMVIVVVAVVATMFVVEWEDEPTLIRARQGQQKGRLSEYPAALGLVGRTCVSDING